MNFGVRKLDSGAIVQHCLHDLLFSRFDTIPECDRHTDRQTHTKTYRHTTTAYATLSIASHSKNEMRQFAPLSDISQGSVATHFMYGGMFNCITANCLLILAVKKFN